MYQNITQLKVLYLFIDNPFEKYYLREASRLLRMSPMTLKRSLDLLLKNKLILREKIKNQILYSANLDNPAFRHIKIARNLSWFVKKDIVGFIRNNIPGTSAVMLYGSYAKGEDSRVSDIDLIVIAPVKKDISGELSALIGKEVNLSIFSPAQWSKQAASNKAFYLDVITEGIILYGMRPVVG
jgi:predicted nucleotidyltransferase